MPDPVLSELIDQSRLAREVYFARRGQELSPDRWHSAATLHALTENAELAWKDAEQALWTYRASQ